MIVHVPPVANQRGAHCGICHSCRFSTCIIPCNCPTDGLGSVHEACLEDKVSAVKQSLPQNEGYCVYGCEKCGTSIYFRPDFRR